jgi:hypothetical protein
LADLDFVDSFTTRAVDRKLDGFIFFIFPLLGVIKVDASKALAFGCHARALEDEVDAADGTDDFDLNQTP